MAGALLYLLTGEGRKEAPAEPEKVPACIPAEGLQVVVAYYRDGQLLHQEMPEQPIELGNIGWYMERESAEGWVKEPEVHVSIYEDAEVAGKINGNMRANVVHGPVKAAGDVYRNEEEQE